MKFSGMAFSDYEPEVEQEQEPTIERGKDVARFWVGVLAVLIVSGAVIGYAVSASYTKYPYSVNVSGTWLSPDGGLLTEMALPACDEFIYPNQCPDPGQNPRSGCFAPPDMNQSTYCEIFAIHGDDEPGTLGHYNLTLRNGEAYHVAGSLSFPNGTFDKVCFETISLVPDTSQGNVTDDFDC